MLSGTKLIAPGLVDGLIPRKGGAMPAPRKCPEELRDRAQRLVAGAMSEDPSLSMNAAVRRIGRHALFYDQGAIHLRDTPLGRRSGA